MIDSQKVTCFYRYNSKSQQYEYNHYEDGWIFEPKKVLAEMWEWEYSHEFKVGTSITTNGVFK